MIDIIIYTLVQTVNAKVFDMKKILAISALILAAHCSALSQGQLLAFSGQGPGGNDPVSTKPLKTVLLEIEKHYHVYIVADNGLLEEKRAESIDKTLTVEQALKSALNDTELTF